MPYEAVTRDRSSLVRASHAEMESLRGVERGFRKREVDRTTCSRVRCHGPHNAISGSPPSLEGAAVNASNAKRAPAIEIGSPCHRRHHDASGIEPQSMLQSLKCAFFRTP